MKLLQKDAYRQMVKKYDTLITGGSWWTRLYMHGLWGVDDNALAQEVLAMISDDFRGKILDVPVGTAVFTAGKYARMAQAEIVGLDYSQEMLEQAKIRLGAEGVQNVTLLQGDVGQLPFGDNTFEGVLSMNGFQAFPDNDKALAEIYRVLKPEGIFWGSMYVKGERPPADWVVRRVLDKKGFFCPPHYTRQEAIEKLRGLFGDTLWTRNERSMLLFRCVK